MFLFYFVIKIYTILSKDIYIYIYSSSFNKDIEKKYYNLSTSNIFFILFNKEITKKTWNKIFQ